MYVTPRKRRVSRNENEYKGTVYFLVTPRKRRVSRNAEKSAAMAIFLGHASQEACE